MDISKLEALACLRLNENNKNEISKSLDEVVETLQSIINVEVENIPEIENKNQTDFREQEYVKPMVYGLNVTDDGLFLAPKVIKKD